MLFLWRFWRLPKGRFNGHKEGVAVGWNIGAGEHQGASFHP